MASGPVWSSMALYTEVSTQPPARSVTSGLATEDFPVGVVTRGLFGNRGEHPGDPAPSRRRPGGDQWDEISLAGTYGETAVREALVIAGRAIGTAMATVVATLDVSHVVLAPELLNGSDILVEAVRDELGSRILPSIAEMVEVEATQLGADLVLSGAASAVLVDRLGAVLR